MNGQATPSTLNPGQSGILTFSASDNTGTVANNVEFTITIDNGLTINSIKPTPSTGSNAATCNPPVPGLGNTNVITCNLAALGGPKTTNPTITLSVVIGVTAPNRTGVTFLPSATVNFDGITTQREQRWVSLKVK